MASCLVKVLRQGQRAGNLLEQAGRTLAVQQPADLHTSTHNAGSLTIPERLVAIPEAEDPGFFEVNTISISIIYIHIQSISISDGGILLPQGLRALRYLYLISLSLCLRVSLNICRGHAH